MTRRPRQTTKHSRTLAYLESLQSPPDVSSLDDIDITNHDPEPNWIQARNDHSQPLAENPPIPKEYLYYDSDMKAYVYDPNRKMQKLVLEITGDMQPTGILFSQLTKQFPEWLPIPADVAEVPKSSPLNSIFSLLSSPIKLAGTVIF